MLAQEREQLALVIGMANKEKADVKEDISNIANPMETKAVAKSSSELEMEQHSEQVLKEAREHQAKTKKGGKK